MSTLPPNQSYNGLLRRWSDTDLVQVLTGSPVLQRARGGRAGVAADYALVASAWQEGPAELPRLEDFDEALAAVNSRAFAELGPSDTDAMVPLLDLMNHQRGLGSVKDCSYARTEDGAVEVKTLRSLVGGDAVRDTYGAKGNPQLLSNYGFCIRDNLEPDGSSNDILEFELPGELGSVDLRAGPKAYTYGGFVKAVEMLAAGVESKGRSNDEECEDMQDDMDAFVDAMGEEEEEEDEEEEEEEGDACSISAECKALKALESALEAAANRYSLRGQKLSQALKGSPPTVYGAIVVASEQRTIGLFLHAARMIQGALSQSGLATQAEDPTSSAVSSVVDSVVLDQAQELVKAYMQIRHPSKSL